MCPPNKPSAYHEYVLAAGPTSSSLWRAVGQQWAYVSDDKVFNMMNVTAAGLVKAADQGLLTKCSLDALEFETQRLRPVRDT